jgi:hypothetical protein
MEGQVIPGDKEDVKRAAAENRKAGKWVTRPEKVGITHLGVLGQRRKTHVPGKHDRRR